MSSVNSENRAREILRASSDQDRKQFERTSAYIAKIEKNSIFFKVNRKKQRPKFDQSEIEIGDELGRGEFSTVCEITHVVPPAGAIPKSTSNGIVVCDDDKSLTSNGPASSINGLVLSFDQVSALGDDDGDLDNDQDEESKANLISDRAFMSRECIRHGIARYAIKRIRPHLEAGKRQDSMIDLALEAKFLSVLSHPNIIHMRGYGLLPCHSSFFIILDRLYETLGEKILHWKEAVSAHTGFMAKRKKAAKADIKQLWGDRIMAAYDIARALRYLHQQKIAYRDLKPENIGFDVRGDAKVFDFGLSKELNPRDLVGSGLYNMSGLTGSRRYMAPEVVLCNPYNEKADVYSFGILLWEMCALEVPFNGYNAEKHSRNVVRKHERPKISSSWPVSVGEIIGQCWSPQFSKRPAFDRVCPILASEASNFLGSEGILDRSTKMMDRSESSRRECYQGSSDDLDASRRGSYR